MFADMSKLPQTEPSILKGERKHSSVAESRGWKKTPHAGFNRPCGSLEMDGVSMCGPAPAFSRVWGEI